MLLKLSYNFRLQEIVIIVKKDDRRGLRPQQDECFIRSFIRLDGEEFGLTQKQEEKLAARPTFEAFRTLAKILGDTEIRKSTGRALNQKSGSA